MLGRLRGSPGTLDLQRRLRKVFEKRPGGGEKEALEVLRSYRVDYFGNVVALDKPQGGAGTSLCMFDVDHIFPWRRGGGSKDVNFMALQCYANRNVKKCELLNVLDDTATGFLKRMQCGLSIRELVDIFSARETLLKTRSLQNRFDVQCEHFLKRSGWQMRATAAMREWTGSLVHLILAMTDFGRFGKQMPVLGADSDLEELGEEEEFEVPDPDE